MKKIVLIGSISLISALYANEPSVYGAGDIDSPNPYGLSKTEQGVLDNRREIQNLKNRVSEQQNRIDGLITIIDGLNKEILSLKEQLRNMPTKSDKEDDNRTYSILLELGAIVDKINNSYVSKEELQQILSQNKSYTTTSISNQNSTTTTNTQEERPSVDISTVYRRAVQLFSQRSYNEAKRNFLESLANNYKPASANYYLGEIAYYTKNYPEAIEYYKKSASLYDNASYMKILYLHTALSLARIGEKEQARNFFKFVIDNYPGTKAADIAKKNL